MAVQISVYGSADLKALTAAQKELDKLKSSATKNAGGFKGAMSSIGSAVSSTGAKIAAGLAAAGVARWLTECITKAQEMAGTQALLKAAVVNSGAAWDPYSAKMETVVRSASNLSGFYDDELRGALTQMTVTTGSASVGLEYLGTVQDLARMKGMSASQAAVLLGKAYDGNVTSLKRLGIMLPAGTKGVEALAAVQKKVAGSAKAYGETSAGAQARFNAKLEELQETIGGKIMPAFSGFLTMLGNVFNWFGKLSSGAQTTIASVIGFAGLAAIVAPFVSTIAGLVKAMQLVKLAQAAWTGAQWLFNAAMSANPIGLIIIAVVALIAVIVLAWTHCAQFRAVVTAAFNGVKAAAVALWSGMRVAFTAGVAVVKGVFSGLSMYFGGAWKVLSNIFLGGILLVVDLFTGKFGRLKSDARQIWNNVLAGVRQMWSGIAAVFTSMAGPIISGAKAAFNKFVTFMKGLPGKVADFFAKLPSNLLHIGTDIVTGLWNGIRNAWHTLTSSVGSLFAGLVSWIRNLLGIHSPSTVFASMGANLAAGLANGMTGGIGAVTSAASRMAAAASFSANATFGATATGGGSYGAYGSQSLAFAGGGSSSRTVNIAPGAVQVIFPPGTSAANVDVEATINRALKQLADQVGRR
jgi:hypothetical protein